MPSLCQTALFLGTAASVSAGTVFMPFSHSGSLPEHLETTTKNILKRAADNGTTVLFAVNNITGGGYYAEFGVGTPPQKLNFQLDTGSSDTWMNSDTTTYCSSTTQQQRGGFCSATFKPSDSSTFKTVSSGGFDIEYLDKNRIQGDYFQDVVSIGGHNISSQQLGLAVSSVRGTGIMGLGFSSAVAAKTKYPTIVDNMVTQGVIDHPTFSLYFNGLDSKNGSVLFGGVDSGKYYDTLATLPLRTPPNVTDASASVYAVSLKGLAVSGVSLPAVANDSIAILDSGSTMSLIPDSAASAVGKKYGVVTITYQGASTPPFVDCAYSGDKGKNSAVKFSFEGKDIYVPIKEMVVNAIPDEVQRMIKDPSVQGVPSAMRNWDSACLWGIASAEAYGVKSNQFYLLGDTFLRSAYAVYDMSNKKIGLAQANLNSTQSNVIEIAKDATTLPTAAGAKAPDFSQISASSRVLGTYMALLLAGAAAVCLML